MANENLIFENARIIFRNFSGEATKYNHAGARNFCVVIDDHHLAEGLNEEGWNVKMRPPREEGGDPYYYLQVKINYNSSRPPMIYMVTERKKRKTLLNEETVGSLDYADIVSADIIINPSHWDVNGKTGISAYLKTAYITISEDVFASKYDTEDDEVPF